MKASLQNLIKSIKGLPQAWHDRNVNYMKNHILACYAVIETLNTEEPELPYPQEEFKQAWQEYLIVQLQLNRIVTRIQKKLLLDRIWEISNENPQIAINTIRISTRRGYPDFFPPDTLFETAGEIPDARQEEVFRTVFEMDILPESFITKWKEFRNHQKSMMPNFKHTEITVREVAHKIREVSLSETMKNGKPAMIVHIGVAEKYLNDAIRMKLRGLSKHGIDISNPEKQNEQEQRQHKTDGVNLLAEINKRKPQNAFNFKAAWENAIKKYLSVPGIKKDEMSLLLESFEPDSFEENKLTLLCPSETIANQFDNLKDFRTALNMAFKTKIKIFFKLEK